MSWPDVKLPPQTNKQTNKQIKVKISVFAFNKMNLGAVP